MGRREIAGGGLIFFGTNEVCEMKCLVLGLAEILLKKCKSCLRCDHLNSMGLFSKAAQ